MRQVSGGATNDHELLKTMANCSVRRLRSEPSLTHCRSEYQFFVRHTTRKTYQTEFVKCTRVDCDHCSKSPIQAVNFFHFLKRHGGMVPTPKLSSIYGGHYSTLLHHAKIPTVFEFGENLPSLNGETKPLVKRVLVGTYLTPRQTKNVTTC